MITFLHKLSRSMLNIIAWPLMIAAIVMSGIAWNGAGWKFTDPATNMVNINAIVFIAGISIFGLNIISLFIRPLRKISKVIFSIASLLIVGFLAYSFAIHFQQYNWTFEYTGPNRQSTFFWGFGFITLVSIIGIYLITGLIWLFSLSKKHND